MKEKSQIEKKAEARQAELLSAALGGASNAGIGKIRKTFVSLRLYIGNIRSCAKR